MVDEQNEQRRAAEALASVREHQERTRRAARVPGWIYPAMFIWSAGALAANDFISVSGSKMVALVIMVALVATLVAGFVSGSAPLSRVRGVQRRQALGPRMFGLAIIVSGLGAWLIVRYGAGLGESLAGAVGLAHYPYTVTGVLYGAAFTALFGLEQFVVTASERRTAE